MALIRKFSPIAVIVAGLLFVGAAVQAGGDCCAKKDAAAGCPIEAKVTALVAGWEAANAETAAMSEQARTQLSNEMCNLVKDCPIGSRMGVTMATVQSVLAGAIAAEEACQANCAAKGNCSAPAAADGKTPNCEELFALFQARTKILRGLNQVAMLANNCTSGGCKTACGDMAKKGDCGKEMASKDCGGSCPIQTAMALGELKARWSNVAADFAALTPEKKQTLFAGFTKLSQQSKSFVLMQESFGTLVEGFAALDQINGKVSEWAKANPDFMKALPADAVTSFKLQSGLIKETSKLLQSVCESMSGACKDSCPDGKASAPSTAQN